MHSRLINDCNKIKKTSARCGLGEDHLYEQLVGESGSWEEMAKRLLK